MQLPRPAFILKFITSLIFIISYLAIPNLVKAENTIATLKEIKIENSFIDTLNNKVKKAPFTETITSLNQKILKLEKEQKEALNKEKGFFGKLTEDLASNYREQKLIYFRDLRDFLVERGADLETIGKGLKKVVVD
jgi:hypothetical protein